METPRSTVNLLSKGCFMVTIDLKDKYYHIHIHSDLQKCLQVAVPRPSGRTSSVLGPTIWNSSSPKSLHQSGCGNGSPHQGGKGNLRPIPIWFPVSRRYSTIYTESAGRNLGDIKVRLDCKPGKILPHPSPIQKLSRDTARFQGTKVFPPTRKKILQTIMALLGLFTAAISAVP